MHTHHLLKQEVEFWKKGFSYVAGVDEAGRGPLAGPVVAAAVMFNKNDCYIRGIKDSKLLSAKRREEIAESIHQNAISIGIGICEPSEIDQINILQASLLAMRKAIQTLNPLPDQIIVDGRHTPATKIPCMPLIKGDFYSRVVAAASIIAKVERDQMMVKYDKIYPLYGFAQHKGYPTQKHINAIENHGLLPIHRRSFKIKQLAGIDE